MVKGLDRDGVVAALVSAHRQWLRRRKDAGAPERSV